MEHSSLQWTPEITWIQPYVNSYFKSILGGVFSLFPHRVVTNKSSQEKQLAYGVIVVPKLCLGS